MSTGQKYSGKGDSATQTQTNDHSIDSTVNPDPSTDEASTPNNYGVPGLAKFFAKHPNLTDLHKKMLAGLYSEGEPMKVVKDAARMLLGSEVYDAGANNPQTSGFEDIKELFALQELYNLDENDMGMLEALFEAGHSSEVIIAKAKRLSNLAKVEGTPFATSFPQTDDTEFIKSLNLGYDLTPNQVLTVTGMVQMGCPRDLIERSAKRFGEYPAMVNILDHILGLKATEAPAPVPKPSPTLSAQLDILVNARFGTSHANVLIFALTEYQDSRLKEAMKSLAEGLYDDAAYELSDSECAGTMLTELALSLSKLADSNYWATRGETPEHDCKPSNVFESYAKHYFGFSDERIQQHVKENY